ncbi:hypothetical protein J437_LFUL009683 [Ladona fulva]|uniref:Uncharacterized protein n=1 Tax=Ladona fulva TaxID=123851 RepID=A0A8K0P1S8_LADFU|nr:hypothetical protein J437_LFUL009683 [Ladona fulva]
MLLRDLRLLLREDGTAKMAFMMPVVKNDWDIYRSNRSRRSSECSNSTRSRKVSECRSEGPSLSTSPGSDFLLGPTGSPPHRSAPIALRHSRTSLPSPSKSSASSSNNSSPPKSSGVGVSSGSGGVGSGRSGSQSSLNKFHSRCRRGFLDGGRGSAGTSMVPTGASPPGQLLKTPYPIPGRRVPPRTWGNPAWCLQV